jgi:hypothetical protein
MRVVRGRSSPPAPKSRTRSAASAKLRAPIARVRDVSSKLSRSSDQSGQVVAIVQGAGSRFVDDLPSKSQIFDHWKDRLAGFGISIHWREPCCWACGFNYGARYRIKRPDVGWREVLRRWDDIPLQRCHIIPRSLGGTNEVANLFLMCAASVTTLRRTQAFSKYFSNGRVLKIGMSGNLPGSLLHSSRLAFTAWTTAVTTR